MSPAQVSTSNLFAPIKVGTMNLNTRVVMAPMTRLRTNSTFGLLKVVKEYYTQRASTPGTFLISEGTIIGAKAAGFPGAPGIWTDEHISGWKEVVDAVHAKGSYIYLQIAAMGRVADPAILKAMDPSYELVGAGDIPMEGGKVPRPMTVDEIQASVALFAKAAADAVLKAGFDGVEVHGANGFLVDQFLQDVSNNRTDQYGGSVENRSRVALEVVEAVSKAVGEDKTAIRLSPWAKDQSMGMKNPVPTYTYLISQLRERHPNLAYIHIIQSRDLGNPKQSNEVFYDLWTPRPLVIADGFTREKALKAAKREGVLVEIIVFKPDLPLRLKADIPLSAYDRGTFYGGDETGKGYTDYAFAS